MKLCPFLVFCLVVVVSFSHGSVPVPYAGKVSIDGQNYHGQLNFTFAIYTASNDLVWDSGSSAIEVPVINGRYLVLLGGQGMRPLPASLFHANDELYVGVYADLPNDNVGQVKLGELQRITAQPYALVAEMAKSADTVKAGAITTAQLNEQILKYLKPEITHKPNVVGVALEGQSVTLNAQAEGKYLSYQWYKNDQPIPGAVKNRYVINDVNKSLDDGNYSLLVSNEIGSIRSDYVRLEVGKHVIDLNATVSMDMIWCPPGTFTMGSPLSEAGRQADETEHNVSLTRGFYLGKYEVTQAQYEAVMTGVTGDRNATPSNWHGNPNRPVEQVSWLEVQEFLLRLNAQQAGNLPAGWSYVLPTESQWEYACRAGTTTAYSWGNDINSSRANYNWDGGPKDGNDFKQTLDVGMYDPNPWGFYDMHGNVREWVNDRYTATYPTDNPVIDPTGPTSGKYRVTRGHTFAGDGEKLRSARRTRTSGSARNKTLGFRVAIQPVQLTVTGKHTVYLNDTVAMDMIWCSPGSVMMLDGTWNEHNFSISRGFYLGKYEVTQTQYNAIMGASLSIFGGKDRPVDNVNWYDAVDFCRRLTTQERHAGHIPVDWEYALTTKAQWYYAYRAGTNSRFPWGDSITSSNANYNWDGAYNTGNDFKQTRDVGQYAANSWGFFDMYGNVMEWTADIYKPSPSYETRWILGDSWLDSGDDVEQNNPPDFLYPPGRTGEFVGFRVAFQKSQ